MRLTLHVSRLDSLPPVDAAPYGCGHYCVTYYDTTTAPCRQSRPVAAQSRYRSGGRYTRIAAMGTGTLAWDNGEVSVEAVGFQGEPVIKK